MVVTDSVSRTSRIDGWKSIARYLGRDRATAMRWETSRGLPVHRYPGGGRASVYAFEEELDSWLAGEVGLDPQTGTVDVGPWRRRSFIGGTVAVAVSGVAGLSLIRRAEEQSQVASLLEQARVLRSQNTLETQNQAIGLANEAVLLAPMNADAWGALGYARATASRWRKEPESRQLRELATMDGQRSLDLEPGNAKGELALASALPLMGKDNWLIRANGLKRALERDQADPEVLIELAWVLRFSGHCNDAAAICKKVKAPEQNAPLYNIWSRALWSAGRIEERDRVTSKAAALYPSNKSLWFSRIEMMIFGGETEKAIAFARMPEGRPSLVTDDEVTELISLSRTMDSRKPAEISETLSRLTVRAKFAIRPAINAVRVASMAGRLDEAFALVDAYLFGRGREVSGNLGGGLFMPTSQRHTNYLFEPPMAPMRDDLRFKGLLEELGLERYWRESRHPPDFRQT